MDNLTVREANVGDVNGIAKIHVETWQYAYRGQLPDAFLDACQLKRGKKFGKKNFPTLSRK